LALSVEVGLGVLRELLELEVDELVGPKGMWNLGAVPAVDRRRDAQSREPLPQRPGPPAASPTSQSRSNATYAVTVRVSFTPEPRRPPQHSLCNHDTRDCCHQSSTTNGTTSRQLTHQMVAGRAQGARPWDRACLRRSRRAAASRPPASSERSGGSRRWSASRPIGFALAAPSARSKPRVARARSPRSTSGPDPATSEAPWPSLRVAGQGTRRCT